MKKLVRLAFALVLGFTVGLFASAAPSQAQSLDASIGYSYFHLGGGGNVNQNGISGSLEYKPNSFFGVVGDFGGYHASPGGVSLNTYTFLFGPRISVHNPSNITPFIQFLIGGAHLTASAPGVSTSSNNLAYSLGGGVDLGVLPHLALRPQLDYVRLHDSGGSANCARLSLSAVVRF
jgi:opacity protein-like surface antigen